MTLPAHTIKLQDGNLFNFKRRFKKRNETLLQALSQVKDGRGKKGKRHPLETVLVIVFFGMLAGKTTLKDCWLCTRHNYKFLKKYIEFPHGIISQTAISRALAKCDLDSLVSVSISWRRIVCGWEKDESASFDGKTMKGVHGEGVIRHILSLFTHQSAQTIGQVGVTDKENEIPAARRLFDQTEIAGLTLVADALHAQTITAASIIERGANYLLFIKGNQSGLEDLISISFKDPLLKSSSAKYQQHTRGRHITTTVSISADMDIDDLRRDWVGINYIGKVRRVGTRTEKGITKKINETVYFIASKFDLTAKKAARLVRDHWRIENNLHWQKDYTFHEDRNTLRIGVAPQVMTYLRSLTIGIIKSLGLVSVSETVNNLGMSQRLHYKFALAAGVVG